MHDIPSSPRSPSSITMDAKALDAKWKSSAPRETNRYEFLHISPFRKVPEQEPEPTVK
jgi:hypothetical protein